ncbi:hypothetical protein B0H12DRAFT_419211 [Mycena haematopus]|nr:hypothetical protein B0H12DRAFT_419211 [Mycena haematopus]
MARQKHLLVLGFWSKRLMTTSDGMRFTDSARYLPYANAARQVLDIFEFQVANWTFKIICGISKLKTNHWWNGYWFSSVSCP